VTGPLGDTPHRMEEQRTAVEHTPVMAPLLERDSELNELRRALTVARSGAGRLLVIEGPSGIGKSRLLGAARSEALGLGMAVFDGRGEELETEYGFALVLRLLDPRRLSSSDPVPSVAGPEPAADEFALIHGAYRVVVDVCAHRPAAMIIDDVHWADELSLRFLVYLAHRIAALPLAMLVSVRTGDPGADAPLVRHLWDAAARAAIAPVPLSVGAVGSLLARIDARIDDAFVQTTWEATRGNPFLVNETIAAIRVGEHDPADWAAGAARAPRSVERRVVLRLARLGGDAHGLARAVAVLGDGTPLLAAAQLAGLEPAAATAAAARLIEGQILDSLDPLHFAHPLIRSAVYQEIPRELRLLSHTSAARLRRDGGASPDEVARHLLTGAPTAETWACESLQEAARRATRRGAHQTALRCLRRALDSAPSQERRPTLLVDLGLVEAATGEATSLERFQQALETLDDRYERARAMRALGQTLYRFGRHPDAASTFRRGIEMFAATDPDLALTFQAEYLCSAWFVQTLHGEAMADLERIVAGFPEQPETPPQRVMLAVLAMHRALGTGPASEAATLAYRALGDGALLREQTADSIAVNLVVAALACAGREAEALTLVDAVLEDARTRDVPVAMAEVSLVRAYLARDRGQALEAVNDARAALAGVNVGTRAMTPIAEAILIEGLIERGDLEAATRLAAQTEHRLASPESRLLNTWFHLARGRVRHLSRDYPGALADFFHTGEIMEAYGQRSPYLAWRVRAAYTLIATGDCPRAEALIAEELALSEDYGLPSVTGAALRARACLESAQEARASLARAAALLEAASNPLELARVLSDLGEVELGAGDLASARVPLRRALELAHSCDAASLEATVRSQLIRSGARPRRAATSGVASLTPAELRIARLAASGLANPQIAERLVVSRSTVEWHLGNVYRKLGAARQSLASVLQTEDGEQEPASSV
jgi:DNA-binding CsgD family transcriptional regulator